MQFSTGEAALELRCMVRYCPVPPRSASRLFLPAKLQASVEAWNSC